MGGVRKGREDVNLLRVVGRMWSGSSEGRHEKLDEDVAGAFTIALEAGMASGREPGSDGPEGWPNEDDFRRMGGVWMGMSGRKPKACTEAQTKAIGQRVWEKAAELAEKHGASELVRIGRRRAEEYSRRTTGMTLEETAKVAGLMDRGDFMGARTVMEESVIQKVREQIKS